MLYSQNYSDWKFVLLGNNTERQYTIGSHGCNLTSQTYVINNLYGTNYLPTELMRMMISAGCYPQDSGVYLANTLSRVFPDLVEENYDYQNRPADLSFLMDLLKEDEGMQKEIVLMIDSTPQTKRIDQHYVVLLNSGYEILDPWDGQIKSLSAYLGAANPNYQTLIQRIIVYKKQKQKTQQPMSEEEKNKSIGEGIDQAMHAINDMLEDPHFEGLKGENSNVQYRDALFHSESLIQGIKNMMWRILDDYKREKENGLATTQALQKLQAAEETKNEIENKVKSLIIAYLGGDADTSDLSRNLDNLIAKIKTDNKTKDFDKETLEIALSQVKNLQDQLLEARKLTFFTKIKSYLQSQDFNERSITLQAWLGWIKNNLPTYSALLAGYGMLESNPVMKLLSLITSAAGGLLALYMEFDKIRYNKNSNNKAI